MDKEWPYIQLVTLWFVVLIFVQTDNEWNIIIELISLLLMYTIPIALVIFSVLQLVDN